MKKSAPIYIVLPSRLILFAIFQIIIAIFIGSWTSSIKFWLISGVITNIFSVLLLIFLFKQQDKHFFDIFKFQKNTWKSDLKIFALTIPFSLILVLIPSYFLNLQLWGNTTYSSNIMFQTIPIYFVYFLLIVFPITIFLSELALYFGYCLPQLKKQLKQQWIAVLLPIIFLSLQHITLPLVFDLKFILYRGAMYFPFALYIGIILNKRPSLFLYFAIMHGVLDFGTVLVLLTK